MKKVLMVLDYFYNGGIEKIILDIKNNIDNKYIVDILSFVNKSNESVISLLDKEYNSFFKRNIIGIRKYNSFLKSNIYNYDIIHIHCYNAFGLIYAFIAKKYFNKIIVHAHNCNVDNDFFYIKHLINNIIKIIFKNKKYIYIAVSEESNIFCFNEKNSIILPNAVDYNKYCYNIKDRNKYRKIFNIKNDDIVIGHIGRFNKQKNHAFIIDVFNEICKISNNYKLILVGEGKLRKRIEKKIEKLKLTKKVLILNNRSDIPKFINMFDIYLFPSLYEGFGITIVENEINGKYLFVSNIVPKGVVISNRLKFISLDENAKYWANKIINLKDIKLLIDGKLNIDNYCKQLSNVYRGLTI